MLTRVTQKRALGTTEVSAIGFGCMSLSNVYGASDDNASVALLREAHAAGARFVVFPELALTTFFPRWWMIDQAEIDAYFEHAMPGPETRPLFDLARDLGVGFYLGYA